MSNYIDDIFGVGGLLSQKLDNYNPRQGQIMMAKAVDQTFRKEDHLMVEGPTGTGKSLAYCVPAIRHALEQDKRVAIVTANIALQEQLVTKDLPFLAKILPTPFTFSLIKGRNNYLCLDNWLNEQSESTYKGKNKSIYKKVMKWGGQTSSGDKSELDFELPFDVWSKFSISSDECKGKDCNSYKDCYVKAAKIKAESVNIFVTNYHMLFADLKVRMASGNFVTVLPTYDYIILDEVHKAADIARDFFGFRVTENSIRFIGGALNRIKEHDLYETLQEQSTKLFYQLKKLYKSRSYKTRFKTPPKVSWEKFYASLLSIKKIITNAANTAPTKDEKSSLRKAATASERIANHIYEAMNLEDDNSVYYMETLSNGAIVLKSKPVTVDKILAENLFDTISSSILTSATLSVSKRFNHIKQDLGCLSAKELIVSSPFDFSKQALLIAPDTMPSPTDMNYQKAVAETVIKATKFSKGRTLALFTSYRNLEYTYEKMLNSDLKFNILKQGDVPRTLLIQQFKNDVSSVLLGTESFWTGVDVPGEALSCVIIDRLPFPTPDDPVLDAITSRDRNWFMHYSVPRAIIAFKQGFGRLIRKLDDKGVVIILDKRVVTKSYGRLFLNSLPPVLKSQKLESINKFLYRVKE